MSAPMSNQERKIAAIAARDKLRNAAPTAQAAPAGSVLAPIQSSAPITQTTMLTATASPAVNRDTYLDAIRASMSNVKNIFLSSVSSLSEKAAEMNKPGTVDWTRVANELPEAVLTYVDAYNVSGLNITMDVSQIMTGIIQIEALRLGTKATGGGGADSGSSSAQIKTMDNLVTIAEQLEADIEGIDVPTANNPENNFSAADILIGSAERRRAYIVARNRPMGEGRQRATGPNQTVVTIKRKPFKTVVAFLAVNNFDAVSPACRMAHSAIAKAGKTYTIPPQPAYVVALRLSMGQELAPSYDQKWWNFYAVVQAVMLGTHSKDTFIGGAPKYAEALAAVKNPGDTLDAYLAEVNKFASLINSRK